MVRPRTGTTRVKIPAATARMVLARSGGYCANPSCRRDLFPPIGPGRIATVDTLAHIIAQSPEGSRGHDPLPVVARNDGSNIILLCPTCHKIVDDLNASDVFTPDLLREWKRSHERRVRHGAAIPTFENRGELDREVSALLHENHGIWRNLGPESPAAQDPIGEGAQNWREQVVSVIIPNNRRILELIDANRHLLGSTELETAEDFRVHAATLDLNYNSGRWRAGAPRFPERFAQLFTS
jgi:hypothetical protein